MQYLSVCSGIEAASVAWSPLGFEPLAFSEVDKFPSAVLAHHYPAVQNLGDMTLASQWSDYEPNILVGGTPCQSFSVAGLRKGLADPRGNLMLTYLAIADRYQPEWIVWENVPGVLSSGSGRDFGTFLGALGQIGYGWAYRVLDAQFFGVPQRRRRVFVVGHFGDWRRAAAVLFERHSLQGHPPPSREARQDATSATGTRTFECGGIGSYSSSSSSSPLLKSGADLGHGCEALVHCAGVAHATTTHQAKGGDPTTDNYVAHSLRGEGFDASEDGTGRGTPLVPVGVTIHGTDKTVTVMSYTNTAAALRARSPGEENSTSTAVLQPVAVSPAPTSAIAFDCKASEDGTGRGTPLVPTYCIKGAAIGRKPEADPQYGEVIEDVSYTQNSTEQHAIAFGCKASGQNGFGVGEHVASTSRGTGHGGGHQAVAFTDTRGDNRGSGIQVTGDQANTLHRAKGISEQQAVAFAQNQLGEVRTDPNTLNTLNTNSNASGRNTPMIQSSMQVRRLTPRECERLQGFPDGYTLIPFTHGKPAADGPRYKALGNSMAVPVMRWIGERIQLVDWLYGND